MDLESNLYSKENMCYFEEVVDLAFLHKPYIGHRHNVVVSFLMLIFAHWCHGSSRSKRRCSDERNTERGRRGDSTTRRIPTSGTITLWEQTPNSPLSPHFTTLFWEFSISHLPIQFPKIFLKNIQKNTTKTSKYRS